MKCHPASIPADADPPPVRDHLMATGPQLRNDLLVLRDEAVLVPAASTPS